MTVNQRKSYRCALPTEQQQAMLRAGRSEWPVRLLDESTSGFAIQLDAPADILPGETVRLATYSGVWEVRVNNVRTNLGQVCVGLERLQELTSRRRGFSLARLLLRRRVPGRPSSSVASTLFDLGLTLLLAVGVFLALWKLVSNPAATDAVVRWIQQVAFRRSAD